MKKTLTRALSLLLVLVMVLGAMPFAMATEDGGSSAPAVTVKISGPATVEVGTSATYTAEVAVTGGEVNDYNISYKWNGNHTVVAPGEITITMTQPGEWTVVCTVTLTPKDGKEGLTTLTNSGSLTIERTPAPTGITLDKATAELKVGETVTLKVKNAKDETLENSAVTWQNTDSAVAAVEAGKITGKKDGTATITATYEGESATCQVTVKGPTMTMDPQTMNLKVGETGSAYIKYSYLPTGFAARHDVSATGNGVIEDLKVNETTNDRVSFKAAKKGTAVITVTSTNNAGADLTATLVVTVTDGTVVCDTWREEVSSSAYHTLDPVCYTGDNQVNKNVDWEFKKLDGRGNISVNATTGTVTLGDSKPAIIEVGITAKDKTSGEVIAYGETYVSFYVDNDDIEVTMPVNARTLTFGQTSDTKERERLDSLMMEGYDLGSGVYNVADSVQITDLSANEGRLSAGTASALSVNGLSKVVFTAGAAGKATFNYAIYSSSLGNMPLVQGDVTIVYDSADGDIEYSTSYNKSVTFKESDFTKFWDDIADDEDFDGDLDYVMFPVLPETGKMYTSTSSTSSTYAYSTKHQFYCGTVPSGINNKDLGSLTYVPSTSKLTSYDVTIPFVAYGEKTRETASGYVVIHVNETSDSITSRGIFFGTKYDSSNTYADMIADKFEDKTDENLDYVIFELPDVEKATLYSTIPTDYAGNSMVAQGTALRYNEKLYYGSSSSATLKKAALIPAAGFSGTITLEYTAYSKNGSEEYEGTITFTVAKKTKSGVFNDVGTTYNWAADSVDFLYYEGIAQGSNNKYNPAANITRGDFMLMLYRAFLEDDYSTYNVTANFKDVVKGTTDYSKETYQAVGVAKYLGIAQGSNDKYNPKANITREEAMTLIYRTLDKINRDLSYTSGVSASSFTDYSKISSYATTAISNLVGHGVIVGSNNKINPKTNITRAEMACILHRVITY